MGKTKTRILKDSVFLLLLVVVFLQVASMVQRKESKVEYREFYQNKQKIDVLFMGSSHVLYSLLPMELWHEYGICTYNMGEAQSTIPEVYWTLKNALDYQTPKVVVDLYNIEQDEKVIESKYLHNYTDTLPLSKNKIQMITDLMKEGERAEFLWDFSLYHNRWSELEGRDFSVEKSVEKGADTTVMEIYPTIAPDSTVEKTEHSELNTIGTQYMDKIAELCRQNDIQLILLYMPYGQADATVLHNANYGYVLADKYGVPYLNLMYESDLIDYRIDCSDANSHLNPAGSKKVTSFLGRYIVENYEIPNHRTEVMYQDWIEDEKEYFVLKENRLLQASELQRYLLLLNDNQFSSEIKVGNGCELDETEQLLMDALTDNGTNVVGVEGKTISITVVEHESNQLVETVSFENNGDGFFRIND